MLRLHWAVPSAALDKSRCLLDYELHSLTAPYANVKACGRRLTETRRYAYDPEVTHTPHGSLILRNFAVHVCGCTPNWTPAAIIEESVAALRSQIGAERVILGLSGGAGSAARTIKKHHNVGRIAV